MVAGLKPPAPECGCRFEQMYYDERHSREAADRESPHGEGVMNARETLDALLAHYPHPDAEVTPLLSDEVDAIREVLDENERLRAENLAVSRKDVVWYNVAEGLRAKIEAALAECKRTREVPRPLRGSIATANRIERVLTGRE